APMSQIALLMLGEGQAYYNDELIDGKKAMTIRGKNIAAEFKSIVDEYVESHYAPKI
ncbi:MAG: 4-hydroxy-3-methylbut-2-en-1-yl diphosphate synthase, partial [Rhodospirillaceae bacterium]|nr:4-hydroxy-3-methylbut-2-en-1-yl diphosphate synthase [Rhodospirillaceae bacterium]